jgi:hypothetical protein
MSEDGNTPKMALYWQLSQITKNRHSSITSQLKFTASPGTASTKCYTAGKKVEESACGTSKQTSRKFWPSPEAAKNMKVNKR